MANQIYNNFKKLAVSGAVSLFTGTVKMMLVSGAYQFSQTHTLTGQITGQLFTPTYTQGGKKIDNTVVFLDTVENEVGLSGNSVVFSGLSGSPTYGILYISGDTAASNYLMAQVDFGPQVVTNADFTVNWNSEGIFNLM